MDQIADLIGRQNVDIAMVVVMLASVAFMYVFYCEVHFRENKSMSSNQKVVCGSQGIGFFSLLFLVFFVLKLGVVETVVVGWSWWWVTAPLWGPTCLVLCVVAIIFFVMFAIFLCGLVVSAIISYCNKVKTRKERQTKE